MGGISDAVCGLVDGMSTAGMAFVKEHAAGEISPGRLRRYLCDEACSPGQKEVRAEACRSCESACAYGRRFLRLLDAGAGITSIVEDYGVSKYTPVIATLLKNPTLILPQ